MLFGSTVDLAFIDGLHLFEFVLRDFINVERHCAPNSIIALHDCVPADQWMTDRVRGENSAKSKQPDWWTGDVWKCVPALKKYRPDLRILVVDASPTGLALITTLDPKNSILTDHYARIIDEFIGLDIAQYGVKRHQDDCAMISTKELARLEDISKFIWP